MHSSWQMCAVIDILIFLGLGLHPKPATWQEALKRVMMICHQTSLLLCGGRMKAQPCWRPTHKALSKH